MICLLEETRLANGNSRLSGHRLPHEERPARLLIEDWIECLNFGRLRQQMDERRLVAWPHQIE